MQSPPWNKRIAMPIDRLSALPDSILIHIISFLEVKEAVTTSVLSKRWQFLWTELTWLDFNDNSSTIEKIGKFVACVHRTLVFCGRKNLDGFLADIRYDKSFTSDVNAWLHFAVKNQVKEIHLLLNSDKDYHTLPQMMYSNSAVLELSLRRCILAPGGTIKWQSLTWLWIEDVELPELVVEKILSGCPVLRGLTISRCWGFHCLKIECRNLAELVVSDSEQGYHGNLLEISAPYIRSLGISLYPKQRRLQFINIGALVETKIEFVGSDWKCLEVRCNVMEIFRNIKHVKELELGHRCFEVLSRLVGMGWELPQSMLRYLEVEVHCHDRNITGIVSLLESSPDLETFTIQGHDLHRDLEPLNPDSYPRGDLGCDLLHLKTVNVKSFTNQNVAGEPILKLAQIIFKRAVVLEKMLIDVKTTTSSSPVPLREQLNITQALLSYPRFSTKASVCLST